MALHVERSVVVPGIAPEVVFPYLIEPDKVPQWMSDLDRYENQKGITLMTLHAAKGLEFKIVFLSGMEGKMLAPLGIAFIIGATPAGTPFIKL